MINSILTTLNIDKKIGIFLSSKLFSYLSYPITLGLIIKFLTPLEQGYYYTFLTLLSFSMFLELGLGVILTNFSSHEFGRLSWKNNNLHGDKIAVKRSLMLIKKTILWFSFVALLFFLLMLGMGAYFFLDSAPTNYYITWIYFIIVFSPGLIISPLLSLLQGFGRIKEVQSVIFFQVFFSILAFWVALLMNFNIYALVIQFAVQNLISFLYLFFKYSNLIFLSLVESNSLFSWKDEVLPLQLKTGFTWLVSYLGINLLIPFSFKIFGPEIAGQLGMSFKIAEITSIICLAWTNTRVPRMGSIIASKNRIEFNTIFFSTLKSIILIGAISMVGIYLLLVILDSYNYDIFLDRILSIKFILMLMIGYYMFAVSNYLAMTIRAFKDEKMIIPSFIALFIYGTAIYLSFFWIDYIFLIFSFVIVNTFILLPFSIFYISKMLKNRIWD
jgi:hypothetical protein